MTRNTMNAGEKFHLENYRVKFVDSRFKFLISKNPHIAVKTLCGIRHTQHSISNWMEYRKMFPGSQCLKCEKKIKSLMSEAK